MADTEEPRPQSLQERIAALNMGHVGRAPITAQAGKRPPPPPPPLRRAQTTAIPTAGSQNGEIGNEPDVPERRGMLPPPEGITRTGQRTNGTAVASTAPPKYTPRLPPRTNTIDSTALVPASTPRLPPRDGAAPAAKPAAPALPVRRPTEPTRRDSQESTLSTVSTVSNVSTAASSARKLSSESGRLRAPAYDPASLPPLPPKRTQEEKDQDRARLLSATARTSTTSALTQRFKPAKSPTMPALPRRTSGLDAAPSPPARKLPPTDIPTLPPRRTDEVVSPPMPPRPDAAQRASEPVLPPRPNGVPRAEPLLPPRPHGLPTPSATPPPVPSATRPDLSKLLATKPKPGSAVKAAATGECLQCRDFSAPDTHATKFPRGSVPSLEWLAQQLTAPFGNLTDKARAIFTWEHHNINYDVDALFENRVKPSTPAGTLASGLAVCEGYAGLFAALATHAGLEAIVVGGHGKGYGYTALASGSALPPPDPTGHAWNAVRLDDGAWKLLDACWGAGHLANDQRSYARAFTPREFTLSNEDFGRRHFPARPEQQFRADGRPQSWAEYLRADLAPDGGPVVQVFSDVAPTEGFGSDSFMPRQRRLPPAALAAASGTGTVRFSFARICPHWDPLRHGPGAPYAYILAVQPPEGSGRDARRVPFRSDGRTWWVDVEPAWMGQPGDHIMVHAVDQVGGKDARGIPFDEQNMFKGMGWRGVAMWDVV